jgi:hypothetical protein
MASRKKHTLYVLCNGAPDDWAIVGMAQDKHDDVWVARITDVPDQIARELADGAKPSHFADELADLPMTALGPWGVRKARGGAAITKPAARKQ